MGSVMGVDACYERPSSFQRRLGAEPPVRPQEVRRQDSDESVTVDTEPRTPWIEMPTGEAVLQSQPYGVPIAGTSLEELMSHWKEAEEVVVVDRMLGGNVLGRDRDRRAAPNHSARTWAREIQSLISDDTESGKPGKPEALWLDALLDEGRRKPWRKNRNTNSRSPVHDQSLPGVPPDGGSLSPTSPVGMTALSPSVRSMTLLSPTANSTASEHVRLRRA